jgi:type III restriction enzyme
MTFPLKLFQETAVTELITKIKTQISALKLGANINTNIVFKSPTGSGKTIMVAEVLRRLPEQLSLTTTPLAFLWLAPVKLHKQSYEKLQNALGETVFKLVNIDDGLDTDELEANTILFSNWEKLNTTAREDNEGKGVKAGDWMNRAVKRGESGRNLQDILAATREAGVMLVLIIDESHQTFYGERSQRFINEVVRPSLVLEVSATPRMEPTIEISYDEVIESGLIKKEIIVNNDLAKKADEGRDVLENLVDMALTKREELKAKYAKEKTNINPLVLIQLPNEKETMSELDTKDRTRVEEILAEKGITYENGKLALWLAGDENKKNKENVEDSDNSAEVLIFKQVVALGWDCPRAQVLIMLREIRTDSFKVQTIGRILRMPEAEHYDDDVLNTAYVYTDIASLKPDVNEKDPIVYLLKIQKSGLRESLENIVLPGSIHLERQEYGDLRASFKPVFEKVFRETFGIKAGDDQKAQYKKLDEKLAVYEKELAQPIVSDVVLESLDTSEQQVFDENGLLRLNADEAAITNMFNMMLRNFIRPFAGFARTRAIVYPALLELFVSAGIEDDLMKKIIVCSKDNQTVIDDIFQRAIATYDDQNEQEKQERIKNRKKVFNFSVPVADDFSNNYREESTRKNIYSIYYRKNNAPQTEKDFEGLIDGHEKVVWWYKNGEKMKKYFAVAYMDVQGVERAFYPDYIIRFVDGQVGIYDTKSAGFKVEDTKAKAEALQKYIKEQKKVVGGIVIFENGVAKVNSKDVYRDFRDGAEDWADF